MVLAGFLLLAVGAADLVRQFVRPRGQGIGYAVVGLLLALLAVAGDALHPLLVAIAGGVLWVRLMPDGPRTRSSFWPAVVLALLCVLAVVSLGGWEGAAVLGGAFPLRSPFGPVSFDLAVLVAGIFAFLLESGNVVVRAALAGERTWKPSSDPPADEPAVAGHADRAGEAASPGDGAGTGGSGPSAPDGAPASARDHGGFKGGRLIGPLERVIVFLLTLVPAFPLLAAMLAAKGIVRFPEISKDGETGARAEYFLVGSLVSWVMALGGAFLVWWAAHV